MNLIISRIWDMDNLQPFHPNVTQFIGKKKTVSQYFVFTFSLYWPNIPCIALPCGSDGTASTCNAGDPGLIPGLGRSPGEGNGNPLQYSCLKNSMDCHLPGSSGDSPWSCRESDMTDRLHFTMYKSYNSPLCVCMRAQLLSRLFGTP